jgi:hypothetical protein
MKYIVKHHLIAVILSSISISTFGQEVKKFYYKTGQLKSEITLDKTGLMTKYLSWDIFGNLLTAKEYATDYKLYPQKDFSKIKWTSLVNGVSISKFNDVDTNLIVSDTTLVTLNYQCYFSNGQMLDNSFERNCPLTVRLDKMVRGFTEGVKQMQPGETA